jgi:hypothetical protein
MAIARRFQDGSYHPTWEMKWTFASALSDKALQNVLHNFSSTFDRVISNFVSPIIKKSSYVALFFFF